MILTLPEAMLFRPIKASHEKRDCEIRMFKKLRLSTRQIERLTGIGRGIIVKKANGFITPLGVY